MKKIFAFVFSIWIINVIQAIVVLHHGAWSFKHITITELDEVDGTSHIYKYRFLRDVTKDNDFIIHYFFATETSSVNGTVRFCQADVSTLDGTVVAIAAECLGLDMVDGTPCPVPAGLNTIQWSVFSMKQVNLDTLLGDDEPSTFLTMAVHGEDWGIVTEVFTDEAGEELLAAFNLNNTY